MKNPRFVALAPISAAIALLVLSLMAYAGFLTSSWGTLLASAPAILVTIGIVSALASGVILFATEEAETPEEASRPDGADLIRRFVVRIEDLVHRTAVRLHVRGVGP